MPENNNDDEGTGIRFWLGAWRRMLNRCPACKTRFCSVYGAGITEPLERQSAAWQMMHQAFRISRRRWYH